MKLLKYLNLLEINLLSTNLGTYPENYKIINEKLNNVCKI